MKPAAPVNSIRLVSATSAPSCGRDCRRSERAAATAFKKTASGCLEDGHVDLLVDCAGLNMVDSTGLGALVRTLTMSQKDGGQTKLLRPGAQLQRLLKMTQLDSVFECFDDAEAGVASF